MNLLDTWSHKVGRPSGDIDTRTAQDSTWIEGTVLTPQGIVIVFSDGEVTLLRFMFNGYMHVKSIPKGYRKRALVTMADRFSRAVVVAQKPLPSMSAWIDTTSSL